MPSSTRGSVPAGVERAARSAGPLLNRLTGSSAAHRLRRRLSPGGNRYTGEFASFEEARAAIPAGERAGYDNPELAGWYRDKLGVVQAEDYPVLFWLQRWLKGGERVFDFGGHVGLHFYAWRPRLEGLKNLRWTVCEVGAVAEVGRALAAERGVDGELAFTTEVSEAGGAGLFVASGSLQYLEPGFLFGALDGLKAKPKRLLLNKLAVHEARDFITLQDTGASFHPYSVVARATLEEGLRARGYRPADAWENPGHHCHVALRPDLGVPAFSGGCWSLAAA